MKPALLLPMLLCVVATASSSLARTWRVEKDGSGDFTTIQPAVDAAAAGDTVRLGVGRWTEYAPVTTPDWTENVYVHVQVDSLTIIGSGREQSYIGPVTPIHPSTESPIGILGLAEVLLLRVENLASESVDAGLFKGHGRLVAHDCAFNGNLQYGILSFADNGNVVDSCVFQNNMGRAIGGWAPATGFVVRNCDFIDNNGAVSFNAVDAIVEDCTFRGGWSAVQYVLEASGIVQRCTFYESIQNYSIHLGELAALRILHNNINGGFCRLYMDYSASVTGEGNVFTGASYATIWTYGCFPDLHGNHILHGQGPTVLVQGFPDTPQILDMTGNYWGTSSADSIAAWITDGVDDPAVHGVVDFEPFSSVPLPAQKKSLGGVKGLYR